MARRLPNRAERLLADARAGVQYSSFKYDDEGTPRSYSVTASVLGRLAADTPMNDEEGEAFEFINLNPAFIDDCTALISERRKRGARKWSCNALVHVARWSRECRITRVDDEFEINDHIAPTLGRIFNEAMGEPFFELRRATGEPE